VVGLVLYFQLSNYAGGLKWVSVPNTYPLDTTCGRFGRAMLGVMSIIR